MKIAVLSSTSGKVNRGVERVVYELCRRWKRKNSVRIFKSKLIPRKILKWQPDIVIPMNRGLQAILVRFYCWISSAKMVVSGQAGYKDRQSLLVRPDLYIALTERNATWARKYAFGVPVEVIPNGVDLRRFQPKGRKIKLNITPPIILCVAGPERYKRVEETIQAVTQLKQGSLLLAGGSQQQEFFGQKLLGGRFLRQQFKHKQMPAVYRLADVFTLASKDSEAFGTAYLEALASGLPVVAPDDELRREILGKWGIYVKNPTDLNEYALKLQLGLKQSKHRPEEWLREYNWDVIAERYLALFKNLNTTQC